jgi:dsDNA-specific endonuclease/ATPase MutS2
MFFPFFGSSLNNEQHLRQFSANWKEIAENINKQHKYSFITFQEIPSNAGILEN